ncbi:hypothetical protein I5M27_09760 [Adhaeribacter sp. BT258]|uniref:Uncharacterized protein n=1 Tax=Adhaeribacter terrigena TaxID=2793070 RepID=A0ABS1C1I9_9BACT|nr:hypothetical protein [Adhaeribacter terrigena]MBK0403271.1 hypothetical protein [Adhaeribacter terrigena]
MKTVSFQAQKLLAADEIPPIVGMTKRVGLTQTKRYPFIPKNSTKSKTT